MSPLAFHSEKKSDASINIPTVEEVRNGFLSSVTPPLSTDQNTVSTPVDSIHATDSSILENAVSIHRESSEQYTSLNNACSFTVQTSADSHRAWTSTNHRIHFIDQNNLHQDEYDNHQELYTGNLIDLPSGYDHPVEYPRNMKSFSPTRVGVDENFSVSMDFDSALGRSSTLNAEHFLPSLDFMSIFHEPEDGAIIAPMSPFEGAKMPYRPLPNVDTQSMSEFDVFHEEYFQNMNRTIPASKNCAVNALHFPDIKDIVHSNQGQKTTEPPVVKTLPLRKRTVNTTSQLDSISKVPSSNRTSFPKRSKIAYIKAKAGLPRVINHYIPTVVIPILSMETEKSAKVANSGCKCKNSACLKLYCDCFQAGNICATTCKCSDCKNTENESGTKGARTQAITKLLQKRADAFDIRDKKPLGKGCKCKNNKCLKKYCICYANGVKCSGCHCFDCENIEMTKLTTMVATPVTMKGDILIVQI